MTQTRKAALIDLRDKVNVGGEDTPDFSVLVKRPVMQCKAGEAYRGSIDAAKALHEAVLPNYGWAIEMTEAAVWPLDTGGVSRDLSHDECPARAWILAILEALILQEPDT